MATQTVLDIMDRLVDKLKHEGLSLDDDHIEELEDALDDAYTCGVEDGEALAELHQDS